MQPKRRLESGSPIGDECPSNWVPQALWFNLDVLLPTLLLGLGASIGFLLAPALPIVHVVAGLFGGLAGSISAAALHARRQPH